MSRRMPRHLTAVAAGGPTEGGNPLAAAVVTFCLTGTPQ